MGTKQKKNESNHNVNQMIKIEITKQVNKAVWEIINCGFEIPRRRDENPLKGMNNYDLTIVI